MTRYKHSFRITITFSEPTTHKFALETLKEIQTNGAASYSNNLGEFKGTFPDLDTDPEITKVTLEREKRPHTTT